MAGDVSPGVMFWWRAISAIGVVNIVLWMLVAIGFGQDERLVDPVLRREQRMQLALSALFVFGCAYRSFWPFAEAQRFALSAPWFSSAVVSRSVATVAELAIAGQWAVFLGRWTKDVGSRVGFVVSRLVVPFIAFAEVNSWYTALTTDFRGSCIEESTWAITAMLVTLSLINLWARRREVRRFFIGAAIVLNTAYVMFMWSVDVPMYVSRVRADTAAGKTFMSISEGYADASKRLVVTRRWDDWREEMPWMTLYFSAGVWISISLIRSPRQELQVIG